MRRAAVVVLVVIGCVLAPISVVGLWARNTLLEESQYIDTVGPLADDPAIQQALADRVTERIFEAVDVEAELDDAFPPDASFVTPFIADGIERFVHDVALRVVQSEQFAELWDGINRRAHAAVLAVLEGEGTDTVDTRDGKVVLDLSSVIERVQEQLADLGLDIFEDASGDRLPGQIVLFEAKILREAQAGVRALNVFAYGLPVLALVLLAAAVALARDRRRTGLAIALGVALGMALVLTGFNVGRSYYLDAFEQAGRSVDAAAAAYDQVLGFLRLSLRTVFVLALVAASALWLAGPGGLATRARSRVAGLARGRGGSEVGAVGQFVGTHRGALRFLLIALGLVVLVALDHPGPVVVLIGAGLVALGVLLVEFLGRGAQKATGPTV